MGYCGLDKLPVRSSSCLRVLVVAALMVSLGCQKGTEEDAPEQVAQAGTSEESSRWSYTVVREYRLSQGPIMVAEGEKDRKLEYKVRALLSSDLFHRITTTIPGADSPQAKQVLLEAKAAVQKALGVSRISWEEEDRPAVGGTVVTLPLPAPEENGDDNKEVYCYVLYAEYVTVTISKDDAVVAQRTLEVASGGTAIRRIPRGGLTTGAAAPEAPPTLAAWKALYLVEPGSSEGQ